MRWVACLVGRSRPKVGAWLFGWKRFGRSPGNKNWRFQVFLWGKVGGGVIHNFCGGFDAEFLSEGSRWEIYGSVIFGCFWLCFFCFFREKWMAKTNKSMVPVRKVQGHPWEAKIWSVGFGKRTWLSVDGTLAGLCESKLEAPIDHRAICSAQMTGNLKWPIDWGNFGDWKNPPEMANQNLSNEKRAPGWLGCI